MSAASSGGAVQLALSVGELRAAVYACSEVVRQGSLSGRGCPREVVDLWRRLEPIAVQTVHRSVQSAGGAQIDSPVEQHDCAQIQTVGTGYVASRLNIDRSTVTRNATSLGGYKPIGGRVWSFRKSEIDELARSFDS